MLRRTDHAKEVANTAKGFGLAFLCCFCHFFVLPISRTGQVHFFKFCLNYTYDDHEYKTNRKHTSPSIWNKFHKNLCIYNVLKLLYPVFFKKNTMLCLQHGILTT